MSKGFVWVPVLIIVAAIIAAGGVGFFAVTNYKHQTANNNNAGSNNLDNIAVVSNTTIVTNLNTNTAPLVNTNISANANVTANTNTVPAISAASVDEIKEVVDKLETTVKGLTISAMDAFAEKPGTTSTWTGNGYSSGTNPLVSGLVSKTAEMTVTFTPTSATTGTFTSTPLYAFAPSGGDFFSKYYYGNQAQTPGGISRCGTPASQSIYPTGSFAGKYEIVDGFMIWTAPTSSSHENCVVPDQNGNSYSRLSEIYSKGTTLYITNSGGNQIILKRQ